MALTNPFRKRARTRTHTQRWQQLKLKHSKWYQNVDITPPSLYQNGTKMLTEHRLLFIKMVPNC